MLVKNIPAIKELRKINLTPLHPFSKYHSLFEISVNLQWTYILRITVSCLFCTHKKFNYVFDFPQKSHSFKAF